MVPNFALSLSFDGIALLRRSVSGWMQIEQLAFEDAALETKLTALRERAEALAADGAQVLLVLPNEQIRYLDLADPGGDDDARANAVRAALDGATPYAVDELSYDWSRRDDRLLAAAVAQETLDEAESFVRAHGFVPVAFTAIPGDEAFEGAVSFGAASGWTGAAPERLKTPIEVVPATAEAPWAGAARRPQPAPESEADGAADVAELVATPPVATDIDAEETPAEAEPQQAQPEAAISGEAEPEPVSAIASSEANEVPADRAETEADVPQEETASFGGGTFGPGGGARTPVEAPPLPEPRSTVPVAPAAPGPAQRPGAPSFSSIRASREAPSPAAAPSLTAAADGGPGRTPQLRAEAAPDSAAKAPGKKAPAAGGTASKPLRKNKKAAAAPAPEPADPGPAAPRKDALQVAAMRRNAGTDPGPATAQLAAAAAVDPEEERRRMTVFGARGQEIGGKPRFLGLMLTAALLLFLAAVAAWASVFLDEGISGLFRRDAAPTTIAETLPEGEAAEELADAEPEIGPEAVLDTAALTPAPAPEAPEAETAPEIEAAPAPVTIDETAAPEPALPSAEPLSPDEAATRYAATGIWQAAPTAPRMPGGSDVDDLYISSVDPAVGQFDAIALPAAPGLNDDIALEPMRLPPGPDERFDLDPRGLVRATPEGAISPDGHRVFTGPPPQRPPLREAAEDAPEAGEAETPQDSAALAAADALRAVRPQDRPEDLIEQTERASLGGISRSELADMRPVLRPESVTVQAEAARETLVAPVSEDIATAVEEALEAPEVPSGTAQAVASSLEPQTRPGNMSSLVQQAARRAPQQTQTATAAPVRVQPGPRVPQNANVAREATTANQINLRDMNLIGVFGSASNRRALVRLSNGRLQNVKVGDRLDGGRVAAIGEDELRLTKSGRNIVLRMPRG